MAKGKGRRRPDATADVAAALALHRAGRVGDAERLYRQVLEGEPGNAEALHLLGVAALQQGRAEEAVDLIGEAAKRRKQDPQVQNNLGEAYRALGRLDEA
ncbi:MAG: tetratricopeptide repeat protein, partial [Rhodospirillales bacterium]